MDAHDPSRHVSFIVQVKDQRRTDEVANAIRARGLNVERVLRSVGVVGVSGPAELRSAIVGVPGVGMVREESSFDLPPFDERVPQ
jgi:hypothetical protein